MSDTTVPVDGFLLHHDFPQNNLSGDLITWKSSNCQAPWYEKISVCRYVFSFWKKWGKSIINEQPVTLNPTWLQYPAWLLYHHFPGPLYPPSKSKRPQVYVEWKAWGSRPGPSWPSRYMTLWLLYPHPHGYLPPYLKKDLRWLCLWKHQWNWLVNIKRKSLRVRASGFKFSGMREEWGKKEAKYRGRLQAHYPSPPTTIGIFPFLCIFHIEIPIKILFGENLLRQKNNNKNIIKTESWWFRERERRTNISWVVMRLSAWYFKGP